jgi:hypothetical protein
MVVGAHQAVRLAVIGIACAMSCAGAAGAQHNVDDRMQAWSKALGVDCSHCHAVGRWTDASKPTFEFAGRMSRMVDALNAGAMKDVGGITCWTCHRGRPTPPRLPRQSWEQLRNDHAAEFVNAPNRAIAMSVYAASLGVGCSHCHERDRALNTKAPKAMVAKMLPMFDEIPRHFDKARMPNTQCFMCHQGSPRPER